MEILLALALSQALQVSNQRDALPVLLISSKPLTTAQRKYLTLEIEEAKNLAKRDECLYVPLKDAHVFQFGDPMGLNRQNWARLVLEEIQAMRSVGKSWFRASDLSPNVRKEFTEWAATHFSQMPGLSALDFSKVDFTTYGMSSATLDTPGGSLFLPQVRSHVTPPPDKVIVITQEMKEKKRPEGAGTPVGLFIERSDYRRSIAAKGLESYFAWLQRQLEEGRAKFDESRRTFLEKQFGVTAWKVGQEIGELSRPDQAVWRVHARQKLYDTTGKVPTLDEGEAYSKQFKVSSVKVGLYIQIFTREGESRPRPITIEFGI